MTKGGKRNSFLRVLLRLREICRRFRIGSDPPRRKGDAAYGGVVCKLWGVCDRRSQGAVANRQGRRASERGVLWFERYGVRGVDP